MVKIKLHYPVALGRPQNKPFMTPKQYLAALNILHLSQEGAARMLNISAKTASNYVSGKVNIPQRIARAINEVFERFEETGELPEKRYLRRKRTSEQVKADKMAEFEGCQLRRDVEIEP